MNINKNALLDYIDSILTLHDGDNLLEVVSSAIQSGRFDTPDQSGEVERLHAALESINNELGLWKSAASALNVIQTIVYEALKTSKKGDSHV